MFAGKQGTILKRKKVVAREKWVARAAPWIPPMTQTFVWIDLKTKLAFIIV
jgi:hypothetical protein